MGITPFAEVADVHHHGLSGGLEGSHPLWDICLPDEHVRVDNEGPVAPDINRGCIIPERDGHIGHGREVLHEYLD